VNLAFIAQFLRTAAFAVAGGVLIVYLTLQALSKPQRKAIWVTLLGLAILSLFVLHKLPYLNTRPALAPVEQVLALTGFSYVALRLVEVLRAVTEGRYPAPALPAVSNYLLPFHMVAAGPIQAYDDFVQQPAIPKMLLPRDVLVAVERITQGIFKKFVLAYLVQKLFLTNFASSGLFWFLEVQTFFIWVYLDFSAYTDIAVGIGQLIGVATPENFNRPLLARNVIDFWERWHISLSLFIRRNLFIPLQMLAMRRTGGRHALGCAIGAVVISFLFCGLWHGLTWQFFSWGAIQALGLAATYVYGYFLQQRLGTKGAKAYRANGWIRCLAVCATFEFQAFALWIEFRP
jgi:D-alanyl-lipoteichoic acid acyltransferase DltB (MBOAT superfamily)